MEAVKLYIFDVDGTLRFCPDRSIRSIVINGA